MGPAGRRCHARTAPVTPLVAFCLRPDLDPGPQLRQSPAAALLRPACRGGRAKVAGPASELATPALSRPGLAWSPPLCATSIRTGRHPDAPVWELLSAEGGCGSREGPGPQGRNSSFQPQRRPWPRPSPSRTVLSAVTRLRSLPQSRKAHGGSPLSARKLAVFDTWSAVAVHIAMDNTVVMEDISKWQEDGSGRRGCGAAAGRTPPPPPRGPAWGAGVVLEQGHPGQRLGDPWSSHGEDQARGGPGSPPGPAVLPCRGGVGRARAASACAGAPPAEAGAWPRRHLEPRCDVQWECSSVPLSGRFLEARGVQAHQGFSAEGSGARLAEQPLVSFEFVLSVL